MKIILSILLSLTLLTGLCACSNNTIDGLSTEVEVIIEQDKVIYEEEKDVSSNESSLPSDDTSSQSITSDVVSEDKPIDKPEDTISDVPVTQESIYYLNDAKTLEKIKLNGRCEKVVNGITLNMTASAIEFNTDSSNVLLEANADAGVYYSIFVDGKLKSERNVTKSGTNYIALARGLSSGNHNIKIVRETEARWGNAFIAVNIQLDEGTTLIAKDADKVLVEFLGDSMTNGYGNLINSTAANASHLKNQNSLKAYPYLLASHFDLDYRMVAMSGIALKSRTANTYTYPAFYDFYKIENYQTSEKQSYTSSNPQDVDIVVINLGTNDAANGLLNKDDKDNIEEYAGLYTELITNIGYRKDVKIVFVSGVMRCHDQLTAYQGAEKKLKSLGYNNIYIYDCRTFNSGGEGHPSVEEHQEIADILIKFFKDNKIV